MAKETAKPKVWKVFEDFPIVFPVAHIYIYEVIRVNTWPNNFPEIKCDAKAVWQQLFILFEDD